MSRHALRRMRHLPASILFGATVLFAFLGFEAEQGGGLWFAAAGFCLASSLALGLFFPILDGALRLESRRREYRDVLHKLAQTLDYFELPAPEPQRLDGIAAEPPADGGKLVEHACQKLTAAVEGAMDPSVLELLCRGFHGLPTATLWGRATAAQKRELAALLAKSNRLSGFEPRQLTTALEWILERLPEYRLGLVESELAGVERIWCRLRSYSRCLRASPRHPPSEDLLAELLEMLDVALHGALLGQKDLGEVAESVLVEISSGWIRADAGGESARSVEVENLALVTLGIYTAEGAPSDLPLLEHLGLVVARQPMALRMLFGYLWKKSLGGGGARTTSGLGQLATEWDEWATDAEAEIGGGLSDAIHRELRAQLVHHVWPTWLPIAATINEVARRSEGVREQLEELSRMAVARGVRAAGGEAGIVPSEHS